MADEFDSSAIGISRHSWLALQIPAKNLLILLDFYPKPVSTYGEFCLVLFDHKVVKECRQFLMRRDRQNVRHMLIRTHHNNAALLSIYAAQII